MRRGLVLVGMLVAVTAGVLLATPAGAATVSVGITIGAPPQLVVVPGTPVYYAPTLPHNYFFYAGQYYVFHNGAWSFAPTYNGPWVGIAVEYVPLPVLAVPVEYYPLPPRHWEKHGPPPWAPAWGHRKKWEEREEEDD